jgi:nucleoside-diphosphate-sugar epimerase
VGSTRKVFLTGATGTMGYFVLEELLRVGPELEVLALVLPGDRLRHKVAALAEPGRLTVVEGDLTDTACVSRCVKGADDVVHVAALVSPAADERPELAEKINVGSMQNLLRALEEHGQLEHTRLIGIGSVAQTGNRPPPLHWGRVGDPLFPSVFDRYACSKVRAERLLVDSDVRRWLWLRQTAIAYPGLVADVSGLDPIAFHQPLDNCLEWVTARDSGRLIRQALLTPQPDEFWNRVYNVGGGERFRCFSVDFMRDVFTALGLGDLREWFEPHWFATRNFHGHWYLDSDELEQRLGFRSQGYDDFLREVSQAVPAWRRWLTPLLPSPARKALMRRVARKERGTLGWIEGGRVPELEAFYGDADGWKRAPSWDDPRLKRPTAEPVRLSHGYDEAKPEAALGLADFAEAAGFRGGALLSGDVVPGELRRVLRWRCAFGHEFDGSAYLVLKAGHWCPHCQPPPWRWAELAARNPFLAQVAAPAAGARPS